MAVRRVEDTKKEVISYIIRNGVSSRKEIAEKMGVTNATLTHVVTGLINDGIIYEQGALEEGKVGRKQIMIDVYENIKYVIGFDVTNSSIRVTILNIRANVLEMRRWDFTQLTQQLLEEALCYIKQLIEQYHQENILGIGLLMQGYMDQDICLSLPIQNIKQQIRDKFSLDIYMSNNVRGLAVTETYFGNECRNYVIIKYGPGIGGVVVADGEILDGHSGRMGEIGHIIWDIKSQKKCIVCGKKGCLESMIGFEPTINKANPKLNIAYPDLKTLLEASENDRGEALTNSMKTLAKAVSIFVDIIDTEKILLAGEIFKEETLYQNFMKYISENNEFLQSTQINRIVNYSEKRLKASGVIVLNEYFGKGKKSILDENIL